MASVNRGEGQVIKSDLHVSKAEMLIREIAMLIILAIACLSIGFGYGLYLCKDKFMQGVEYGISEMYNNRTQGKN